MPSTLVQPIEVPLSSTVIRRDELSLYLRLEHAHRTVIHKRAFGAGDADQRRQGAFRQAKHDAIENKTHSIQEKARKEGGAAGTDWLLKAAGTIGGPALSSPEDGRRDPRIKGLALLLRLL